MNRLTNIGFVAVGFWFLHNDDIKYKIDVHNKAKNILYAFICGDKIKYIGKTSGELIRRMYGYQNPERTQSTNVRVNALIKEMLKREGKVDILVLVDNEEIRRGDFKINLAAGLEDTLIGVIKPEWNTVGKGRYYEKSSDHLNENKIINSSVQIYNSEIITFYITLCDTYYDRGFFNVPSKYESHFGKHREDMDIQLGIGIHKIIRGHINRTDNKNGSPRIKGPKQSTELRDWIRLNFIAKENMMVEVISPTSIRLYR